MKNVRALPAPAPRISQKLRTAIELRVRKGMTIVAACEAANLSTSGWHKAMLRPAVRDFLAETQATYVAECSTLRATAEVRAIEVALDLMQNAKSETIRARMAEFLASGGKASSGVNVHVDARQGHPQGYEFIRPGQKVVEVIDGTAADKTVPNSHVNTEPGI